MDLTSWKPFGVALTVLAIATPSIRGASPQQAPAQQPSPALAGQIGTPTFRTGVRWVDVDAVVRDRRGNFITGLTKDDFEVFEDGKLQTLDKLTFVDLPALDPLQPSLMAPMPVIGSDFGNAGRIYTLVLADGPPDRVSEIATLFIERYLGPTDLMAVVNVHGVGHQGLTNDKARLLGALEGYRPPGMEPVHAARRTYATLKEVAVNLGAVTGRRKNIIFISRGLNLWATPEPWLLPSRGRAIPLPPDDGRSTFENIPEFWRIVNDATRTAAAFNVPIHTVSSTPRLSFTREMNSAQADRDSGLRLVSEETGGIDLVNATDLPKGFGKIVDANTRYYVLGYYSSVERNTRFHRISVRTRRTGLRVDARDGFRAMAPQPKRKQAKLPRGLANATEDALRGRAVPTALDVEVSAMLFRSEGDDGSVLVSATIDSAGLDLSDGKRVEVSAAVVDEKGRIWGADGRSFTFEMRPDTRARAEDNGLHFFTRVPAPRGVHTIRVVAHQPGGLSGVATIPVEVPDFTDGTLFFSDVVLSSGRPSPSLTLLGDSILRRLLPGAPALERTFTQHDQLQLFTEIYNGQWLLSSALTVKWEVVGEDGAVVTSGEENLPLADRRSEFSGTISLERLPPGSYTLNLEALAVAGPPAFTRQQVRFDVTPGVAAVTSAPLRAREAHEEDEGEEFEVVSLRRVRRPCDVLIQLNSSCESIPLPRASMNISAGGRLEAMAQTPLALIRAAYRDEIARGQRTIDLPGWAHRDLYDLIAFTGRDGEAVDDPVVLERGVRSMLKALLADRFKLRTRIVARKGPITRLRRTDNTTLGPNLRVATSACDVPTAATVRDLLSGKVACGTLTDDTFQLRGVTMADVARMLSRFNLLSQDYADGTGLQGRYDVELRTSRPLASSGLSDRVLLSPPTAKELKSQLGLKLESGTALVDQLVIENIEKPVDD
jgi:uncharacterized protein (TIGR03435 family)